MANKSIPFSSYIWSTQRRSDWPREGDSIKEGVSGELGVWYCTNGTYFIKYGERVYHPLYGPCTLVKCEWTGGEQSSYDTRRDVVVLKDENEREIRTPVGRDILLTPKRLIRDQNFHRFVYPMDLVETWPDLVLNDSYVPTERNYVPESEGRAMIDRTIIIVITLFLCIVVSGILGICFLAVAWSIYHYVTNTVDERTGLPLDYVEEHKNDRQRRN